MTARVRADEAFTSANLGCVLGTSAPFTIAQDYVDDFARITGDTQWIHVDVVRAAAGPYGGTIAHGYLVLALLPALTRDIIDVPSTTTLINYGLDRVRFVGATHVGRAVRDVLTLEEIIPRAQDLLIRLGHDVVDAQSGETLCAARTLTLYRAAAPPQTDGTR